MTKELSMTPFTILVADDNWEMTRVLKYNLENKDVRVIGVPNGLDCLKALQQGGVDLILLDLGLPDFDGWGILSLLRLTRSLRDIPVLVVSVRPPDANLLRQFEPVDYIQKPFDIPDLLRRVRRAIGLKKSQQPASQ